MAEFYGRKIPFWRSQYNNRKIKQNKINSIGRHPVRENTSQIRFYDWNFKYNWTSWWLWQLLLPPFYSLHPPTNYSSAASMPINKFVSQVPCEKILNNFTWNKLRGRFDEL
jgi:hypothetical protein